MMRKMALGAACALAVSAGVAWAGTQTDEIFEINDERLSPIAATIPPMSVDEIGQRCHGFFKTLALRDQLARSMGITSAEVFDFLSELPLSRLRAGDPAEYVTSYMVEFGPLNPARTARSGLFAADRKTCTEFLDALG